jgi:sigma-B regulation protein RsbU (phosphoserine phosphatase)
MSAAPAAGLRLQLQDRRRRLAAVVSDPASPAVVMRLLREVDDALGRMEAGSFGRCVVCAETIDDDDLHRNPSMRYCLCDLDAAQRRALERDMVLAWTIQAGLLPVPDLSHAGWSAHYRYAPAGPVGGDFCDLVPAGEGALFLALGDVSGKGIAASLLMAHLSAAFRAGVESEAPPGELLRAADRLLLARGFASHYATVVYGRAHADGSMELANAGHLPPLHVQRRGVSRIERSGLPIGVFGDAPRSTVSITLEPGDLVVLYTDGVTEQRDGDNQEFGLDGLADALGGRHGSDPHAVIDACLASLRRFAGSDAPAHDDLTLLALRRD